MSLKANEGLIHVTDYYASTGGGAAQGHVQFEKIKKGSAGAAVKRKAYEYTERSSGEVTVYPVSKETVFRNDDGTGAVDTLYSYTWHAGTVQMEERVTTLPAVPASQHGSGTADTRTERFDIYGNLTWVKDERGFLTRHTYDIPTGARTETIEDVATNQVTDEPAGWVTPAGGGLHLSSQFDHDDQGRTTESRGPWHTIDIGGAATSVRRVYWTVYKNLAKSRRKRRRCPPFPPARTVPAWPPRVRNTSTPTAT